MSSNRAVIHTDGACSKNGQAGARGGAGIDWGAGHPNNQSIPLPPGCRQTNNEAELAAARHAVEQAKSLGYRDIVIKTDSEQVVKGMNEWVPRWKENDYRTAGGRPVINREAYESLDRACDGARVRFEKVSREQNAGADALARSAARGGGYGNNGGGYGGGVYGNNGGGYSGDAYGNNYGGGYGYGDYY